MAQTLASHRRDNNSMFPHPRPLPRDDVVCVGRSGSRGRGETRGQRRRRLPAIVETTTRPPHAPTGTHSAPIRNSPGDWLIFPPPTPIPPEKIPTHLRPRLRENVPVPLRATSDAHRKPIGTISGVRNNPPCHGNLPPLRSPVSAQLERSSPTCSNRCAVPPATAHPAPGGYRPQTPTEFRDQSSRGQSRGRLATSDSPPRHTRKPT